MFRPLLFLLIPFISFADFTDISDETPFCQNEYYTTGSAWNVFCNFYESNGNRFYQDNRPELFLTSLEEGSPDFEFYINDTTGFKNIGPDLQSKSKLAEGLSTLPFLINFNRDYSLDICYLIRGQVLVYFDLILQNKTLPTSSQAFRFPASANYNISAYGISDFNNDNSPDLIIGVPHEKTALYLSTSFNSTINTYFTSAAYPMGEKKSPVKFIAFDYNNDNKKDLYIIHDRFPNSFYLGNGDGTFSEDQACLLEINDPGPGRDGVAADINNDGFTDLIIGNSGYLRIYINENGTSFQEKTVEYGSLIKSHCNDITPGDYNQDGWTDIFIAVGSKDPKASNNNILLKNNGGLSFEKVESSVTADTSYSTCANFIDYDDDGDLDLFVGNHGKNKLYKNNENKPNSVIIANHENVTSSGVVQTLAYNSVLRVYNGNDLVRRIEIQADSEPMNTHIISGLTPGVSYRLEVSNPMFDSPLSYDFKTGDRIIINNLTK